MPHEVLRKILPVVGWSEDQAAAVVPDRSSGEPFRCLLTTVLPQHVDGVAIDADRAVVTANNEAAARGKNILKRISTIKANLQDATVEAQIGIHVRCFKVEVVSKGQLR